MRRPGAPRIALVLSGGAARGAYEAGVVSYLLEGLVRDTGVQARFDVLCGSSVGALNACFLAATAHKSPAEQRERLVTHWTGLKMDDVLRIHASDVMRFVRSLLGASPSVEHEHHRSGAVDPRHLEQLVIDGAPWSFISRNLREGRLEALTISATHVVSGRTVVFVQRADGEVPAWGNDPFVRATAARIRPHHALASAAIPILFPAVAIDGQYYCDGGLRQNTPLSPAIKLGAERVLVVSLRHVPAPSASVPPPASSQPRERASVIPGEGGPEQPPSPYFLFGKVINALWLDHVYYDLERMSRTNAVLEAGERAFGPGFEARLNEALGDISAAPLRRIQMLRVEPSRDIGALAAEYARAGTFLRGASGITATVLRRMALAESPAEADLLSYLLFDGAYCKALIDLGYEDARARSDVLARFFDGG